MNYEKDINGKIKAAMIAKDKIRLDTLRAIKTAILNFNTSGKNEELDADAFLKMVKQEIKKRKDAIKMYGDAGRAELLDKEETELAILMEFMPEQMSDDEVTTIIASIVEKTGASEMKDMGKVMGMAMGQLKGKADGGLINTIVKELLSGNS